MINLDLNNLNILERKIYDQLLDYSKSNPRFRIIQAAELCDCSVSKISKFVKKLGFANFKQYLDFLYGNYTQKNEPSSELSRISKFIDEFDATLQERFLELIYAYDKIIFYGYGPSLLCAQYFEYRLRTCTNKMVTAISDEIFLNSSVDTNTLLIILTVSGTFQSFEQVYNEAKSKHCHVVMLIEEYNTSLLGQCDQIFWLSKDHQPSYLKAYEKSRTFFFIFLEEIIQQIQANNRTHEVIK